MSDARTTLEVVLKATGFDTGTAAIKKLGDEATVAQGKLKTTTSTVDQVSKSSATLGSRLKNIGSSFAGTITNVAALGSTVVNLTRQYQDLGDTQIAVEKAQRRVSTANEAVRKAQTALNTALSKYGQGSAQAKQAALDLAQAQSQLSINTQLLTERQEDHQRAQENFWMGLAPTILTAGASVTSMMKEMGGAGGLTGLVSKFKGAEGSAGAFSKALEFLKGNISAVVGVIGGLAGALVILEIGAKAQAILDKMSQSDVGRRQGVISAAFGDAEQIKIQSMAIKEYDAIVKNTDVRAIDLLYDAIFGTTRVQDAAKNAKILDEQGKILQSAAVAAIDLGENFKATAQDYVTWSTNMLNAGKSLDQVKKFLYDSSIKEEDAVVILDAAMKVHNLTIAETTKHYGGWMEVLTKMAPQQAQLQKQTDDLAGALAKVGVALVEKDLAGRDPRAGLPHMLGLEDRFGVLNQYTDEFITKQDEAATAAEKANKEIADANVKAAAEAKKAWETQQNNQIGGINKLLAAYLKLNPERQTLPGKKPQKETASQQAFAAAESQLTKFQAKLFEKLTNPQMAKDFVTSFVNNTVANMGGMSEKIFQPITDYVKANAHLPADQFMAGLEAVIQQHAPTLGSVMNDIYNEGVVAPAAPAGTAAGEGMSTGFTKGIVPLETKAKAVGKQLDDVAKARQQKTTLKVIGQQALNQAERTLKMIKSKTVTVTVKANLDRQLAQVLPGALSNAQRRQAQWNAQHRQHGWEGTAKRPTLLMVGEGGRQEDISINPRGSAGLRGKGSGGSTHITVSFEPAEFAQFIRYRINDNSGVVK